MLLPQSWNFLREKLEIMNKSISKKVETFVMNLYLRNGKYDGNYSNNNIFLFYSFFHKL